MMINGCFTDRDRAEAAQRSRSSLSVFNTFAISDLHFRRSKDLCGETVQKTVFHGLADVNADSRSADPAALPLKFIPIRWDMLSYHRADSKYSDNLIRCLPFLYTFNCFLCCS